MKQIPGSDLWVPDGERHLLKPGPGGRPQWQDYQQDRLRAAYPRVTDWSCAVDVGAHVGLLTLQLAQRFRKVYALEPDPEAYACLLANTRHLPQVTCLPWALGAAAGTVGLDDAATVGGNTGNRQVVPDGRGVALMTLDGLDLDGLGLLKVDVQGYEGQVLTGAENTLMAFEPVLIVEVEPVKKLRRRLGDPGKTLELLRSWNASEFALCNTDHLLDWGSDGFRPYTKYRTKGAYHWAKYESGDTRPMVDAIVERVQRQGHRRLLDVGCGDGLYAAKLGAFGIDNNVEAVALAARRGVACRRLSVYRALELGRTFDAVCLFDCFEHLPKQELALRIVRRLAPVLYLVNPNPKASVWHTREFTPDELAAFCAGQGWREEFRLTEPGWKRTLHGFRVAEGQV